MSSNDDKVYICDDNIHTINHGFDPEIWAEYIKKHSEEYEEDDEREIRAPVSDLRRKFS